MNKRVIVTIDPMGNPKVEAQGFNGLGCEDATKNIEKALSGTGGVTRELKPEWYQEAPVEQTEKQYTW